jgi:hypothetical protein
LATLKARDDQVYLVESNDNVIFSLTDFKADLDALSTVVPGLVDEVGNVRCEIDKLNDGPPRQSRRVSLRRLASAQRHP